MKLQDISDVMIELLKTKIVEEFYVGDSFQQIYSFRFATNALNKIDLPSYELTKVLDLQIVMQELYKYI